MKRPRNFRAIALTGAIAGAMVMTTLVGAGASSHREAPLITEDPVADNTDVYAFVPPNAPNNVALIANWIPLEEPASGPNFHKFGDDVLYTINIDNNGDAVEDIIFEFRFRTEVRNGGLPLYNAQRISFANGRYEGWNIPQTMTVTRVDVASGQRTTLGTDLVTPPVNVGPRSTPNYASLASNAIHELAGGIKVFAGQRDEIFPVDLGSIFDLLGLRPFNELHAIPLNETAGVDTTSGFNVHSIAIEMPKNLLTQGGESIIGVWSDTYRRQTRTFVNGDGAQLSHDGPWVQVSRLGNPLVNEVVIPLQDKDRFNASDPADDAQFLDYVQNTFLDNLIVQLYGEGLNDAFGAGNYCFPDPDSAREDLVAIFLTGLEGVNKPPNVVPSEQLRLNTAIAPTAYAEQSPMGLLGGDNDGYPNGRRPIDDVTDIALQAVAGAAGDCAGEALPLGDGVRVNGDAGEPDLLTQFPYLPAPHQGYAHEHDHDAAAPAPDEPAEPTDPEPSGDARFIDVPPDHLFFDAIQALAEAGVTLGCNPPENTRFCPADDLSRGQMAAFLVRALDLPPGDATFNDTRGHLFESEIAALADAGITFGCGNGNFCPDEDVNRGQMAAFLDRALDLPDGDRVFTDTRGHLFQDNIAAIAKAGITIGCNPPENTRFCPDNDITRGQMAAFLFRAGVLN